MPPCARCLAAALSAVSRSAARSFSSSISTSCLRGAPWGTAALDLQQQRQRQRQRPSGGHSRWRCSSSSSSQEQAPHVASTLDEAGHCQDPPDEASRRARAKLFSLLAYRLYTRKGLHAKLERLRYPDAAISWALQSVQDLGMQSDLVYAKDYAGAKWRQSRWASSRIRRELRMKGVSHEVIDEALLWLQMEGHRPRLGGAVPTDDSNDASDVDGNDGDEADSNSEVMYQQLMATARRRAQTLMRHPPDARRRRLVGWLQRTGHDWGTVRRVLHDLGWDNG